MNLIRSGMVAAISLSVAGVRAECPERACYEATLQVDSCQVRTEDFISPANTKVPSGFMLAGRSLRARAVACDGIGAAVRSSREDDILIRSERSFFYYSWAVQNGPTCDQFTGKAVSVFVPNVCCDPQHSYACFVHARVVRPPIPHDIACGSGDGKQEKRAGDHLAARDDKVTPCS
jgi:hypothetical protein